MLKFADLYRALEKKWQFHQSSWIQTRTSYSLYQISSWKFFEIILNQIKKNILTLSSAESQFESNNNQRFLLKRQKTRNVHIF